MAEKISSPFLSLQLDSISEGYHLLRFPVRDGNIQINPIETSEITTLVVNRNGLGDISLRTVNGRGLQAEIVEYNPDDHIPHTNRLPVFDKPIEKLELFRDEDLTIINKDWWTAKGENLEVTDMGRLEIFIDAICDSARKEQERRRRQTSVLRKQI